MEVPRKEEHDMPIPISSTYGGHGHMINDHRHRNPANSTHPNPLIVPSNGYYNMISSSNNNNKEKPVVNKYRECLKNHAASTGGHAIDGCGDFMPNGEEGSIEALTCSACNCHRNFHRREVEGEDKSFFSPYHHNQPQKKLMFHHHHKMIKSPLPQQMILPIGVATAAVSNSESEDGGGNLSSRQPPPYNHGEHNQKKRFRTKFTQEQKEKMLSFAERIGWKMPRQDESVVQQFCQEVGVRRRVLKVWIHNNKHNLSKKNNNGNTNVETFGGNNGKAPIGNLASSS
ncbi:Zinc-finger homeodomain protein 3 [Hirschfeldia incana]|nr:Zinc-finger homeodomain protein 3 [Hirschfeldia incana]KAJ0237992.1 Zinc-finger homeodomain protein 3 [Hirschfeldia incana]